MAGWFSSLFGQKAPEPAPDACVEVLRSLTPRERAVFDVLVEGYTMKEAAGRLGVSYSTVNTHMNSVYRKLGVNSRAQLILRYREAAARTLN